MSKKELMSHAKTIVEIITVLKRIGMNDTAIVGLFLKLLKNKEGTSEEEFKIFKKSYKECVEKLLKEWDNA